MGQKQTTEYIVKDRGYRLNSDHIRDLKSFNELFSTKFEEGLTRFYLRNEVQYYIFLLSFSEVYDTMEFTLSKGLPKDDTLRYWAVVCRKKAEKKTVPINKDEKEKERSDYYNITTSNIFEITKGKPEKTVEKRWKKTRWR